MRGLAACAIAAAIGLSSAAFAEPYDDGTSKAFYESFAGKKVVMIPYSMGEPIGAGIATGLQRLADERGFSFSVRDPNWSIDQGVQAISQLINEKPDVLVVQNIDMQGYARAIKQAEDAGIRVVQINVKSIAKSTGHIGVDWYWNAYRTAEAIVAKCSPKNGGNGKIAILQGTPNNPTNFIGMKAFKDVMEANPDMVVVSDQAADWDPSKAHSVVATVLRQNPDLCGYFGFWDGQDSGLAAAVREAGLTGKVFVASQGGAERSACDMVANGSYDYYRAYNVRELSKVMNAGVSVILQTPADETVRPFSLYSESRAITKDNMTGSSCWSMDEIKAGL
ncbi:sugar ABC transporter substrate-binding protein [Mesorhizobium sp. ASY16-5R]|jgi:ribose transport system substrate-binding protein|uniref:sugar ABC transporter substrate-binding protein n=1 Tax=Mesorhizobium sp. ASY16-5R TaxID=3445772 RepID=UPI003F9F7C88